MFSFINRTVKPLVPLHVSKYSNMVRTITSRFIIFGYFIKLLRLIKITFFLHYLDLVSSIADGI